MDAQEPKERFQSLLRVALKNTTGQIAIEEGNTIANIFGVANDGRVIVKGLEVEFEDIPFVGVVVIDVAIAQIEQVLHRYRLNGQIVKNAIDLLPRNFRSQDQATTLIFQNQLLQIGDAFPQARPVVEGFRLLVFSAVMMEGSQNVVAQQITFLALA